MKSLPRLPCVLGLLTLALPAVPLSASTREPYNLSEVANLSLSAGAAPVSVVLARTDGLPSDCPVKLAITVKGEVEANGGTAGFYDEVVLRAGSREYSAFAGDAWAGPGAWSLNDPYRGKLKSRTFEVEVKPGEAITLEYLTRNQYWNGGWAHIQSVKRLDGGCGSGGCGGGSGGVGNQCVSMEINLGSQLSADGSAGLLRLKVEQPTAAAYSPAALELVTGLYDMTAAQQVLDNDPLPTMAVINTAGSLWEPGETLRQVLTPAILADIVPLNAVKYEVRVYPRGRVTGRNTAGFYELSGDATDTLHLWTIENPAPAGTPANQRVLITRQSDCLLETFAFEWIPSALDWQLTRGLGAGAITELRSKVSPAPGVTVERLEILNHLGAVAHEESDTWETTPLGERLLARTLGGGTHAKTTTYDYWPAGSGTEREGRLRRLTGPEGRWEYFHAYDAHGNVTRKVEQYLDHPFTGAWPDSTNRVTEIHRVVAGESFVENFTANLGGFTTYSTHPPQNWAHRLLTTEAHAAIEVSGVASQPAVDAWLISPPFHVAGSEQVGIRFRTDIDNGSADGFTREVYLLKNYTGDGFPLANGAEAVNLTERFGSALAATAAFATTPLVDITADASPQVRLAFRYQGKGRRWKIDDVTVSVRRQIEETTTVTLAGQVISRSWLRDSTPGDLRTNSEAIEGRTVITAVATDLSATALDSQGNRVTRRDFYPKDAQAPGLPLQPRRTIHPDGTVSLFTYEKTASRGLITREWGGEADPGQSVIVLGYLSVQEENSAGHVIATRRYHVRSGAPDLLIESMDAPETDTQGRPTKLVFGDGGIIGRTHGCSGLKSETDREGVRTENKYDEHGRLTQIERWHGSVRESYLRHTLDAAGRRTHDYRWGRAAGSERLVRERGYHTNGELAWEIDALNRQTDFTETTGSGTGLVTRTQSLPGLPQLTARAETRYPDGSARQVTGLAATPVHLLHTVEENPAQPGQHLPVVTTALLDAAGSLPMDSGLPAGEFTSQGSGPGGAYAFERRPAADGSGTVLTQTWSDAAGRPTRRLHADGRIELAAHTLFGSLTALDVDGDGQIGLDGADAVRRTTRSYLPEHGTVVRRDTVEERTAANTWQLLSQTDTELLDLNANGLETWTTDHASTTHTREILDRAGRTRKVITTLPDLTRRVADYADGRLFAEYALPASGDTPLRTISRTHDGLGRLTKLTDSLDGDTDFEYHADDRLAKTTSPDPDPAQAGAGFDRQITTFAHVLQPNGDELTTTTLPGNLVRKTLVNPRGQTVRQWGHGVNPQAFTYTPAGRVETLTTWQEFDQAAGVGTGGSATTLWRYNTAGLLEQVFYNHQGGDPQNPAPPLATPGVRYAYTAGGLLLERTAARVDAQQQPVETLYNYDDGEAGEAHSRRLLGIRHLHHGTASADVSYTYHRNGQPERVSDSSGTRRHEFTDGLLTKVAYETGPLAGLEVGRAYDSASGRRIDRLTAGFTGDTPFHAVNFGYADDYGRLKTLDSGGVTLTYGYRADTTDATSLTIGADADPPFVQEWRRDHLRRVHTVRSTRGTGPAQQVYHETLRRYDDLNRAMRDTLLNGAYWSYGYDALGQLSAAQKHRPTQAAFPGHQFGYTHDAIGNRTGTVVNGRTASYTANLLNQYGQREVPGVIDVRGAAPTALTLLLNDEILTRTQGAGAPEDFYQAVAVDNTASAVVKNLRVQAVDLATSPAQVATESRTVIVPQTPEVFTHDADGNLTEDGRWLYSWDADNRLVAMETRPAAVTAGAPRERLAFTYDDQSRRVAKRTFVWDLEFEEWRLQATRLFLWNGWTLLAELTVTAFGERAPAAAYVWGLEQIAGAGDGARQLALVRRFGSSAGTYAAIQGHNYNLAGYVDLTTGEQVAAYDYGAFGEPVSVTGPQAREFTHRFSTKPTDDETGLSYYGFRYYNPGTGRWLSRDPIAERGGMNLYGFVMNDPANRVDLLGLTDYPGGHHEVPRQIWREWNTDSPGREVFRQSTVPANDTHKFDIPHRQYNEAVRAMWEEFRREKGINCTDGRDVTSSLAEEFLHRVRRSERPAVSDFLRRINPAKGLRATLPVVGLIPGLIEDIGRAMRAQKNNRTYGDELREELRGAGPFLETPFGRVRNPYWEGGI